MFARKANTFDGAINELLLNDFSYWKCVKHFQKYYIMLSKKKKHLK